MTIQMLIVLLVALEMKESGGNTAAFNSKWEAVGALQIRQPCLTDVNEYYEKKLTLGDMRSRPYARWVAVKYFEMHRCQTYEDCVKTFYAGPSWSVKEGEKKERIDKYWNDVSGIIRQLERRER